MVSESKFNDMTKIGISVCEPVNYYKSGMESTEPDNFSLFFTTNTAAVSVIFLISPSYIFSNKEVSFEALPIGCHMVHS